MTTSVNFAWESLNRAFNWKKHPGSVFYLVVPLALLALSLHAALAVHHWRTNGDWAYAAILAGGLVLGAIALVPAYRMHKNNQRLAALFEARIPSR